MRVIGKDVDATRQVTVVASGTMPNGKAVNINSDGTASVVAETTTSPDLTYGTFTNIENEATQHVHIAADPFNSNRFALVDVDDAGDKNVHLYIITRSGSSITVSPQIMVFESPGNNSSRSMCVWDVVTENKLLICYDDDQSDFDAVVATISGSAGSETATFGTVIEASNLSFTGGTDRYRVLKPIGTTGSYLALFRGSSNYTYWRILTISGTTVTADSSGGSSGTVLVSVAMQPVMQADIDPNDSTKGFAIGVNDTNEDLELYPLTFSGTGTGMTVSAGTKKILKSGRNFLDSHSSPTIKYLTSSKLFVAAQSAQSPNQNELETFLFDYDGSTYTEYTSVFLANPDGEILYHYVDTVSPQADENSILVTMNLNGSPRYVYGAVATCDTSANTVSYNTPARIDNYSGGNAGYISYATQSDAAGTSLNGFSGTDGSGNQRPYVRLTQKGGTSSNIDADSFVGISQSGAVSGGGFVINTKGAVANIPATSYDIANASYDSVSFSVASQDSDPYGLGFNNDGTKMYVSGNANNTIYQYSLSTAFDLSTASYDSVSFSYAAQDGIATSVIFNNDGTKMYTVGTVNDNVYQYSLSTAFDLSTASYDSVSFSVASQDTNPYGIVFNNDGTKLYMVGIITDAVYQYSLSTAYDISTASYDSVSFSVAGQDINPTGGVVFNNDGTKMYMVGVSTDNVYQYSLSTAYDLSTASYDSISFSVASEDGSPQQAIFSSDGTKMFILGNANDTIYQYSTEGTLTPAQSYYVQADGTLGTTPATPSIFAGTAVSATKLIVKG